VRSLFLVAGGLVAGYFAGAGVGASYAKSQADLEWARMLENGMVGPTQTVNPMRGRRG
jgi:hypothetical protein